MELKDVENKKYRLLIIAKDEKNFEKLSKYIDNKEWSRGLFNYEPVYVFQIEVEKGFNGFGFFTNQLDALIIIRGNIYIDCFVKMMEIYRPYMVDMYGHELT